MATTTKSALEIILERSPNRPQWQRDALRRIVAGAALEDADVQELVDRSCVDQVGDDPSFQRMLLHAKFSEEGQPRSDRA
ncbi:hypothetical protein AB9E06_36665 [Rhizobium leguminosarum]|uniref:hypothetical protein n=1 Tax=Rhizobium leguminosarum TaxID=384 RepID=UPI003F987D89